MAWFKFALYFVVLKILLAEPTPKRCNDRQQHKQVAIALSKGVQCYNCLSLDHPGCWDPDHPYYANVTIPSVDCYMEGVEFACIIITAEAAKLVKTNKNVGPVRARTCVAIKNFMKRKSITYSMCERLARELTSSVVFSKVRVFRPKCNLCPRPLCSEPC